MPTPNFHDLPDGSSSISHSEYPCPDIDDLSWLIEAYTPTPPILNGTVNGTHNTAIGASAGRRVTASEIRASEARVNPAWRTAPYPAHEPAPAPPPLSPPPARRPRRRRGFSDPDAAIRKDPNAWSLREAVELCKLLEVVLPEAGFHIALTGGLLYKEGRRKDCDLMFYQIRQVEPNYELLWKYLTVAGVIRSPDYPENGWLVKATYRGKQVDCLFPNAGKKSKKKVTLGEVYKAAAVTPETFGYSPPTPPLGSAIAAAEIGCNTHEITRTEPNIPILYHRSPSAPVPYDPAELLAAALRRAVCEAPVPGDFENPAAIPEPPF